MDIGMMYGRLKRAMIIPDHTLDSTLARDHTRLCPDHTLHL